MAFNPKFIDLTVDESGIATVTLARANVHNAFDIPLLEELERNFYGLRRNKRVKVVVLQGEGRSFCAGADINWMRAMKGYTRRQNIQESKHFARLFHMINDFPKPVIARVQGAALGGGAGLVAICDYVIAEHEAVFGFTEVRLGIIPAVIAPFVIAKIGESYARAFFISGLRFTADKALDIGLVHEVVDPSELNDRVQAIASEFLLCGPEAMMKAKELVRDIIGINRGKRRNQLALIDHTARAIADRRMSREGQEGMDALLKHRKPNWTK